jgi:hypothetical protein
MPLTKASYSMITGSPLNVLDFGASPSNTAAQNDTAFGLALAKITANGGGKLIIPAGTYAYQTTLNFSIDNFIVCGEGRSTVLQFNGTGNCIEMVGTAGAGLKQYTTLDSFAVSGTASATNGILINFYTKYQLLNISVGNVTLAGIATGFNVFGTMLNPTVYNYDWGPSGFAIQPVNGILMGLPVSGTHPYPDTCAVTIINPNIQGVSGSGIKGVNGFTNLIMGGSSEYNTGYGLETLADFNQNTFINIDFEGNDVIVNGFGNNFEGGLGPVSSDSFTFSATSSQNKILGGFFGTITNLGNLNSITDTSISASNGLTDSGTNTKLDNVIVDSSPRYKYNAPQLSSTGFYSVAGTLTAVATATPTTMFASTYGSYMLTVLVPNAGSAYVASTFVIDDSTNCQLSGYANGASISITVSGKNVRVTQTSGAPQDIVFSAIRMPVV